MRVLAVDPGLTRCGVAVVETRLDGRARAVVAEVVRTDPEADHADRLRAVFDAVTGYLDQTQPDVLVVERVFSQSNVRSAMGTAQAAAVCMLAANQRGVRSAIVRAIEGREVLLQVRTGRHTLSVLTRDKDVGAGDSVALSIPVSSAHFYGKEEGNR